VQSTFVTFYSLLLNILREMALFLWRYKLQHFLLQTWRHWRQKT